MAPAISNSTEVFSNVRSALISLRGLSFVSLQRRIARPAAYTSPAAKTQCMQPSRHVQPSRARVPLNHTSLVALIQLNVPSYTRASAFERAWLRARCKTIGGPHDARPRFGAKHCRGGSNCWRFAPVVQG